MRAAVLSLLAVAPVVMACDYRQEVVEVETVAVTPVVPVVELQPYLFQYMPAVGATMPAPAPAMPAPAQAPAATGITRAELRAAIAEALAQASEDPPPAVPDTESPPVVTRQRVDIADLLSLRCGRCHQTPAGRGGVTLLDQAGREFLARRDGRPLARANVLAAVASGQMPPGGALSPDEVSRFQSWAADAPPVLARGVLP